MLPEPFAYPIRLVEARVTSISPFWVEGTDVLERVVRLRLMVWETDAPSEVHLDVACCAPTLAVFDALPNQVARDAYRSVWQAGHGSFRPGFTVLDDELLRRVTDSQVLWPEGFTVGAEVNALFAVQDAAAKAAHRG